MKVLLYNICGGRYGDVAAIAEVIDASEADAAALVEVPSPETAELLARRLGMNVVFGEGNSDAHVAWLSRKPIERWRNHRLPALAKTLLEVNVDGLRLFATHATSRHEEPRHPRGPELQAIADVVRERADLLVGDLNALRREDPVGDPPPGVVPRGDALADAERATLDPLLAAGLVDCFRELHPAEPGWTYTASHSWLRLDYAFAAPSLAARVTRCDVIRAAASDHLPLLVEFA